MRRPGGPEDLKRPAPPPVARRRSAATARRRGSSSAEPKRGAERERPLGRRCRAEAAVFQVRGSPTGHQLHARAGDARAVASAAARWSEGSVVSTSSGGPGPGAASRSRQRPARSVTIRAGRRSRATRATAPAAASSSARRTVSTEPAWSRRQLGPQRHRVAQGWSEQERRAEPERGSGRQEPRRIVERRRGTATGAFAKQRRAGPRRPSAAGTAGVEHGHRSRSARLTCGGSGWRPAPRLGPTGAADGEAGGEARAPTAGPASATAPARTDQPPPVASRLPLTRPNR